MRLENYNSNIEYLKHVKSKVPQLNVAFNEDNDFLLIIGNETILVKRFIDAKFFKLRVRHFICKHIDIEL